jgi:hypothetical protein
LEQQACGFRFINSEWNEKQEYQEIGIVVLLLPYRLKRHGPTTEKAQYYPYTNGRYGLWGH